jgi:FAD-dependent urate hydroxylase
MEIVDVAIIGAGPYGLSLSAHLRSKNVAFRHFGIPMRLWRAAMPRGMCLKSRPFASNLSDPEGDHTLEAFCKATGQSYAHTGWPVPLATFVAYGEWFRSELGLAIEESLVTDVVRRDRGFELTDSNGGQIIARKVVVAIGVEHFANMPAIFSELPAELCTHSSAHTDPAVFHDREVVVIGAGQSALELAGLMHENGAKVTVLARHGVFWNSASDESARTLLRRLRSPEGGLGDGWKLWAYANLPDLFHLLPADIRVSKAFTVLGPAGADWLRDRVNGQLPILAGHVVEWAKPANGTVRLGGSEVGGSSFELTADHLIAATGYRVDLNRLTFLARTLRAELRTIGAGPAVGRDYQSSVAGLYFVGAAAAASLGPVSRFVYGSHHAATTVARRLTGGTPSAAPLVAAVSQ